MVALGPNFEAREGALLTVGISLPSYLKSVLKSRYLLPVASFNNAVTYHHSCVVVV